MQTRKLSNGVEIPMAGYGVYQISDRDVCERCVRNAVSVGYRLFDTAYVYGNDVICCDV